VYLIGWVKFFFSNLTLCTEFTIMNLLEKCNFKIKTRHSLKCPYPQVCQFNDICNTAKMSPELRCVKCRIVVVAKIRSLKELNKASKRVLFELV